MELLFLEETITLEQRVTAKDVIEKIQSLLGVKYYYSHLVVDGETIYEDPLYYLEEHLSRTKCIEVIVKTPREFINDLMLTAEAYIKGAKPEIEVLIEAFYQNPTSENWSQFSQLLEGIQWLNQITVLIEKIPEKPRNWTAFIEKATALEAALRNLQEAVENNDSILIADMIQYEILPVMEAIGNKIQQTIDTEGYRHDIN